MSLPANAESKVLPWSKGKRMIRGEQLKPFRMHVQLRTHGGALVWVEG